MRAAPKQALGTAEADLRAVLAELRWALGGLASSQLPRMQLAAAAAQQPDQGPPQQQPGNEGVAQEAGLQDTVEGQCGGMPDADDAEGDALSRAAEDTTHLAYQLLGRSYYYLTSVLASAGSVP